jgi:hypothetical protein
MFFPQSDHNPVRLFLSFATDVKTAHKAETAEGRFLRPISGQTHLDRMKNTETRQQLKMIKQLQTTQLIRTMANDGPIKSKLRGLFTKWDFLGHND